MAMRPPIRGLLNVGPKPPHMATWNPPNPTSSHKVKQNLKSKYDGHEASDPRAPPLGSKPPHLATLESPDPTSSHKVKQNLKSKYHGREASDPRAPPSRAETT